MIPQVCATRLPRYELHRNQGLLPDLTRVKSGRDCPPGAGAFHAPTRAITPRFISIGLLHTIPCPTASRLVGNGPKNYAPQSFQIGPARCDIASTFGPAVWHSQILP